MSAAPETPVFLQPSPVERLFNKAFGVLVRLGLGLRHNYLLEVRGRTSGKLYSTPVNVLDLGGKRFLVAGRGYTQWVRNAEAVGTVTLRKGSRRQHARLRLVPNAEKPPILKAYLDRFRTTVQRYFPVSAGAPPSAFVELSARYPVFEVIVSNVTVLHDAAKRGDVATLRALLEEDRHLANARSETDARGTYPLHVAAEFDQAGAARLLLDYGADVTLLDIENEAIALGWAAFFGRPDVVAVLLDAGSAPSQRNKHGLTPLGCAVGGTQGRWKQFSNATLEQWRQAADLIRARGGTE